MVERSKIEAALRGHAIVKRATDDQSKTRQRRRAAIREAVESDYHQARLLLLIGTLAGESGSIDGLTKIAKTDFLLRYPVFLERLNASINLPGLRPEIAPDNNEREAVESRMIRYKYGPWDDKYYSIIGGLVGRGLIEMFPRGKTFGVRLTPGGAAIYNVLQLDPSWRIVSARCKFIKEHYGRFSGNRIKNLVYENLPDVVDRAHRQEI